MKLVHSALLALALAATPAAAMDMRIVPALASSDATQALSAMMAAGSRASAVRAIRKVPSVGVVNLNFQPYNRYSDDSTDTSLAELQIMASRNAAGIRKLRSALAANPVTAMALSRHGVEIGDVVGVMISSSGSLRLYIL